MTYWKTNRNWPRRKDILGKESFTAAPAAARGLQGTVRVQSRVPRWAGAGSDMECICSLSCGGMGRPDFISF